MKNTYSEYFHGSGSGSLIGTLNPTSSGLKPFYKILQEGGVTYCGELEQGLEERGVGLRGFSAVPAFQLRYALQYAKRYANLKWSLEVGEGELRKALDDYSRLKTGEHLLDRTVGGFQRKIALLQRRLGYWKSLSEEEKNVVANSFPVVYRFSYAGEVVPVFSDFHDEVGIPEVIPPHNFSLYVPEEKVGTTRTIASRNNVETTVFPLEQLRQIPLLPLNAIWDLDYLLEAISMIDKVINRNALSKG